MELKDASSQIRNLHTALVLSTLVVLFAQTQTQPGIWEKADESSQLLARVFNSEFWDPTIIEKAAKRIAPPASDDAFRLPSCLIIEFPTGTITLLDPSITLADLPSLSYRPVPIHVTPTERIKILSDNSSILPYPMPTSGLRYPDQWFEHFDIDKSFDNLTFEEVVNLWNFLTQSHEARLFFSGSWLGTSTASIHRGISHSDDSALISGPAARVQINIFEANPNGVDCQNDETLTNDSKGSDAPMFNVGELGTYAPSFIELENLNINLERNHPPYQLESIRSLINEIESGQFNTARYQGLIIEFNQVTSDTEELRTSGSESASIQQDLSPNDRQAWHLFVPLTTMSTKFSLRHEIEHSIGRSIPVFSDFETAFPELVTVTEGVETLKFGKLRDWVRTQASQDRGTAELFGLKAPIELLAYWGPIFLAIAVFYIAIVMRSITRHYQYNGEWLSWLGFRRGMIESCVLGATVVLGPVWTIYQAVTKGNYSLLENSILCFTALFCIVCGTLILKMRFNFLASKLIAKQ